MTERVERVRAPKKRKPRRADEDSLRKAALGYLQRHPSSKANLRWVLQRRLNRATQAYGADGTAERHVIEKILDECETTGLLDDHRYAVNAAKTWLARGQSLRSIRARLSQKGVASAVIVETLSRMTRENPDQDLQAAVSLVRRRHLGPYRNSERDSKRRAEFFEKDLGVLARAGFTYHLARRVLEADDEEALNRLLEEENTNR